MECVKVAYIFCCYYPLAFMPFHLWGLLGDHDQHFCELYYHCYDTTNFTHFYFIYHVCIITDQSLTDMPLHSILTLRSIAQSYCSHFLIVLYS
jgi:hypothetical protein